MLLGTVGVTSSSYGDERFDFRTAFPKAWLTGSQALASAHQSDNLGLFKNVFAGEKVPYPPIAEVVRTPEVEQAREPEEPPDPIVVSVEVPGTPQDGEITIVSEEPGPKSPETIPTPSPPSGLEAQ